MADSYLTMGLTRAMSGDRQTTMLLQQAFHQYGLGHTSCFNALDALCGTIAGREKARLITSNLVVLFDASLRQIGSICSIQTSQITSCSSGAATPGALEDSRCTMAEYFINTLMASISNIKWENSNPAHPELFEGILCTTLGYAGQLLSIAVFDEHVAVSSAPGQISTRDEYEDSPARAKTEARYVIAVLERVLAIQSRMTTNDEFEYAKRVKARTQAFMINQALGASLDTFRLPSVAKECNGDVPLTLEVEHGGSEWLLQRIWALVGWDLALAEV